MNIRKRQAITVKKGRRKLQFAIEKRQKFVFAVLLLSFGLFFTEYQLTQWGLIVTLLLPFLTVFFLLWAIYPDIKENKLYQVIILPFIYTFAFGFFYLLTPTSFVVRLLLTTIYAFGLYSLFLSQNIFIVSSSRTIQLLSGARIVSFVITLISYFFLTNIVFSFHVVIFPVIAFIALYTYLLIYHSLWTYTLQKYSQPLMVWVSALTVCMIEIASLVWFWPSSPTVTALFLTGFFYAIVGVSHIWFEKRFFKGILWEYVWVGTIVFFVLMLFTQWGK
ncbi:MAG TPA: hypothetical protein VNW29_03200 [Candidatus Sulfotelmatobacter sp.]|jgi:hypothetical protein|nr:hypothetical protein [Candidatus Sulfotelmatobacter sp.]